MADRDKSSEWQVFGAVALIALGVLLFLNQAGGPWWHMIRDAFRQAGSIAWPLALIGLGALFLINARHGGLSLGADGKRLYRSRTERMVGGVLGGLAEYLGGVDPVWLRIAYVLIAVASGFGPAVLIYIVAMIVIPEEPKHAAQPPRWPHTGGPQGGAPWGAPGPGPTGGGSAGGGQVPSWAQPQPGSTETVQTPPPPPPAPPQG